MKACGGDGVVVAGALVAVVDVLVVVVVDVLVVVVVVEDGLAQGPCGAGWASPTMEPMIALMSRRAPPSEVVVEHPSAGRR